MGKMKKTWKSILFWIAVSETVGILAGILTADATKLYAQLAEKPPLSPPGWAFPLVWSILYALMGVGAGLVWAKGRGVAMNLMVAQLVVNFFWPLLFFSAGAYGFAFLWLVLLLMLVAWMTGEFWKISPLAGKLQIPYLLWLLFAAYLNAGVYLLAP